MSKVTSQQFGKLENTSKEDKKREHRIEMLKRLLTYTISVHEAKAIQYYMWGEIGSRSPEQVRKMEVKRGFC